MAQFAKGDTYVRLLPAGGTFATGTLTFAGNAVANETVTIGDQVYTWKASVSTTANEVKVGASAAASVTNLVAAINATAADAGTLYGSATAQNVYVSAVDGTGDVVDLTARNAYEGPRGNTIATTETMTNGSFGAAKLTGGGATSSAAPTLTTAPTLFFPFACDEALLMIRNCDNVAGTTKTADLVLWGWSPTQSRWFYIGKPNNGTALAEVASDVLSHSETLDGLRRYSGLYCQIVSLGGAGTEVEVVVDCVKASPVSGG